MTKQQLTKVVLAGLTGSPKFLPSYLFYDEVGSQLFQQITGLPEYYLTRTEYEILQLHRSKLVDKLPLQAFDLIELGAGDGLKTRLLLTHLLERKKAFQYVPIDISGSALSQLTSRLHQSMPDLPILPREGDNLDALAQHVSLFPERRRLVLFLGSSIGNFTKGQDLEWLHAVRKCLHAGDKLLIGFDLQKHPALILSAYNDSLGLTRAFNLNLLTRLNADLGANFDLGSFSHFPLYDPQNGEARSYLISERKQQVYLREADKTIPFEWGETIHTETSCKYTPSQIQDLAQKAGFTIDAFYYDCKHYFTDVLMVINEG
jgi:L-histidine N-alpha-methyltransferase